MTERTRARNPGAVVRPAADVYATADTVEVIVDLPGVSPDAVDVTAQGEALLIEATASVPAGETFGADALPRRYRRRFALPERTDPEQVRARLDDGVLRLTLPRAERAGARRITVEQG